MAGRYELLASIHVEPDREAQPPLNLKGEPLDANWRPPDRVYKAGDVVVSEIDLVDRFGPGKFRYIGEAPRPAQDPRVNQYIAGHQLPGDPLPYLARRAASEQPSGQVGTGKQVASPQTAGEGRPSHKLDADPGAVDPEKQQEQLQQDAQERGAGEQEGGRVPGESHDEPGKEQTPLQPAGSSDRPEGQAPPAGQEKPAQAQAEKAQPRKASAQELDRMSANDLRRYAADHKIDLGQSRSAEDMRRTVRQNQK